MRHANVRPSLPAGRQARTPPRPRTIRVVFLFLVVAGAFDAIATLEIIRRGADEWNPLMAFALSVGPWYFFLVKMAMATVCSLVLSCFASSYRLAWLGLCAVAGVYFLLTLLHFFLLFFVPAPFASIIAPIF